MTLNFHSWGELYHRLLENIYWYLLVCYSKAATQVTVWQTCFACPHLLFKHVWILQQHYSDSLILAYVTHLITRSSHLRYLQNVHVFVGIQFLKISPWSMPPDPLDEWIFNFEHYLLKNLKETLNWTQLHGLLSFMANVNCTCLGQLTFLGWLTRPVFGYLSGIVAVFAVGKWH